MTRFVFLMVIHVHPTEIDNRSLVDTLKWRGYRMRDGCDRLDECALRAWDGKRQHGLSGVRNVRGGLWVVLKLEWQPLYLRVPPSESRRGCSSSPPASSSPFSPS